MVKVEEQVEFTRQIDAVAFSTCDSDNSRFYSNSDFFSATKSPLFHTVFVRCGVADYFTQFMWMNNLHKL